MSMSEHFPIAIYDLRANIEYRRGRLTIYLYDVPTWFFNAVKAPVEVDGKKVVVATVKVVLYPEEI